MAEVGSTKIPGFKLEDWLPQEPWQGPPLPELLHIFWPWYKPPGAEFRVSDLVISPTEVNPGQMVTISCLVTNIGAEAGDYTVRLGGDFVAEQTVTLEPGQSVSVSFEVVPDVAKTYHVSVNGLTGSFVASLAPGEFAYVSGIIFTGTDRYLIEASVEIQNVGSVAAVCTVRLQDRLIQRYKTEWTGWHDCREPKMLSAKLEPGESRRFYGVLWYNTIIQVEAWEARFIGDPGEIVGVLR